MISWSNDEIEAAPPIGRTAECPGCHEQHTVHSSYSKDRTVALHSVQCPADGSTRLVGINGKDMTKH